MRSFLWENKQNLAYKIKVQYWNQNVNDVFGHVKNICLNEAFSYPQQKTRWYRYTFSFLAEAKVRHYYYILWPLNIQLKHWLFLMCCSRHRHSVHIRLIPYIRMTRAHLDLKKHSQTTISSLSCFCCDSRFSTMFVVDSFILCVLLLLCQSGHTFNCFPWMFACLPLQLKLAIHTYLNKTYSITYAIVLKNKN